MKALINHPNPQFRRENWMDLNGLWDFSFDEKDAGLEENWQAGFTASHKINVPFVYQSELSGINRKSFCSTVWYQRFVTITKNRNQKSLLHFEGVDYESTVWINGRFTGNHTGGNSSFTLDITPFLIDGENLITLRVVDYLEDMTIPRGKQYWKEKAEVMWFTQMTGIWRDVWLEEVPAVAIDTLRITPAIEEKEVQIELTFSKDLAISGNAQLLTTIAFDDEVCALETRLVQGRHLKFAVGLDDFNDHGLGRWWSPEKPSLYDLKLELKTGNQLKDTVYSYFGMRKVAIEKNKFCLNNRPFFLQMVLDQGYFKKSILTPPSFAALQKDVEIAKELGFNCVRKHMMSCDARYLYLCDYFGIMVWSEMAAAYDYSEAYAYRMIDEWRSVLTQGYNHPSVVMWVPLNESWGVPDIYYSKKQQAHAQSLYYLTKSVDDTRPVISNDGWEHCQSDVFTVHDYSSNIEQLKKRYGSVEQIIENMPGLEGRKFLFCPGYRYEGQPVMCTEMGGVNFRLHEKGAPVEPRVHSETDFLDAIQKIVHVYCESPIIEGICYTQLTDTETEICGLLTWDREPKAPVEKLRKIFAHR